MRSRPLRVALVGCGNHAVKYHAPALRRCADESPEEIMLAAACDLNAERAERMVREFGFARGCTDLDTLLAAGGLDGIVCIMPLPAIAGVGVRLLEQGVPCVIEKPLGDSLAAVRRLKAAARASGAPHMVSMNRRFAPGLAAALDWARAQGDIALVRAAMLRPRRHEPEFVWATGLHVMDAVAHIGGGIADCAFRTHRGAGLGATWYHADLRLSGGARAAVDIAPSCGMEDESYAIAGEGFCVAVSMHSAQGTRVRGYRGGELVLTRDDLTADMPRWQADGTYAETRAFLAGLRAGGPFHPTIADVAPTAIMCHAAMKAAGAGSNAALVTAG